jgi:uncharacterized protein DUF5681
MAGNGKRQLSPAQRAVLREHQFKPGQIGNPRGRPRSRRLSVAILRALQAEHPKGGRWLDRVAASLVKEAADGNVAACHELLDRMEGRVPLPQQVDVQVMRTAGSLADRIFHGWTDAEVAAFVEATSGAQFERLMEVVKDA